MTRLYLARHGETLWHSENRYAGWSDVELTARGRFQAKKLAVWPAVVGLHAIYSSDIGRAVQTADPISQRTKLPVQQLSGLREVNFGDGEGHTRGEMALLFPQQLRAWVNQPAETAFPGGETGDAALKRGLTSVTNICQDHLNESVLIIAHSTLIRLMLCSLLHVNPNQYRAVFPKIHNCAITELDVTLGSGGR